MKIAMVGDAIPFGYMMKMRERHRRSRNSAAKGGGIYQGSSCFMLRSAFGKGNKKPPEAFQMVLCKQCL